MAKQSPQADGSGAGDLAALGCDFCGLPVVERFVASDLLPVAANLELWIVLLPAFRSRSPSVVPQGVWSLLWCYTCLGGDWGPVFGRSEIITEFSVR